MSKIFLLFSLSFCTFFLHADEAMTYTLQTYLSELLEEDLEYKNRNLDAKVTLINSLLEQNRYNPNIYLGGEVQALRALDFSRGISRVEMKALGSIHFNMHLYDAQHNTYMNTRKDIFQDLSALKLIDAKEQLLLLGNWYIC